MYLVAEIDLEMNVSGEPNRVHYVAWVREQAQRLLEVFKDLRMRSKRRNEGGGPNNGSEI